MSHILATVALLSLVVLLGGSLPALASGDNTNAGAVILTGGHDFLHQSSSSAQHKPEAGSRWTIARKTLLASSILLGSAALILENQSDKTYSRYLETANPSRMDVLYERAETYRNLANATLVGAEVCAIALVASLLTEKPDTLPEPGTVKISLILVPDYVGVSCAW